MATYNITTATNIDSLTTKGGGDTYNINGGTLTIDQDSRYGLNQTTTSSLGPITISASLGGTVLIDGRDVWLIPYNTGTGNVPAAGTSIVQGGVSGKLIGVWSAINVAPTASGAAMPASGFIKVKQKTGGSYAAGALTNIGANATGVESVGWIEITADTTTTATLNRLGTFEVRGSWFEVGTTSGTATTTYQLPTSGSVQYYPGVWVETGTGSGVYELYPCAGSLTGASAVSTDAGRGKVCWISTAGVLRLGYDGTNTIGYLPPSGRKIRIPNIICQNVAAASRGTNALPDATLSNRYDFTTSGGGVLILDKCLMTWYLSLSQPYSVSMTDVGTNEAILLTECASPLTMTRVMVGQSAAQANIAFQLSLCYSGGTITDCVFSRSATASADMVSLANSEGFTFSGCRIFSFTNKTNANAASSTNIRCNNFTFTNCTFNARQVLNTCDTVTYTNSIYFDVISGTTGSTNASSCFVLNTACKNVTIDGLTFGGMTNVHPYNSIVTVDAALCKNLKVRNIGTYASPLSLGSANQTAHLFVSGVSAAPIGIRIQRVYVSNTRTNLISVDNSVSQLVMENVFSDYADAPLAVALNCYLKGIGSTVSVSASTSVYGTHWFDCHTSTTASRIGLFMNEETTLSDGVYERTAGTGNFTSAGSLYMPNVNDQCVFTTPYYIIGHTGFSAATLTMGGGTINNHTISYQIDKNNGSGYSGWRNAHYIRSGASGTSGQFTVTVTDATGVNVDDYVFGTGIGTNAKVNSIASNTLTLSVSNSGTVSGTLTFNQLPNETATINAANGFKLKWRITTITTNTAAITSLYASTTSTTTTQAYQYPLDTALVTLTGLKSGSEVRAYVGTNPATATEIGGVESSGTSFSFSQSVSGQDGYIRVMATGWQEYYLPITYAVSDVTIPVSQVIDRQWVD